MKGTLANRETIWDTTVQYEEINKHAFKNSVCQICWNRKNTYVMVQWGESKYITVLVSDTVLKKKTFEIAQEKNYLFIF